MAHAEQQAFCLHVKASLPAFFRGVRVIDFGSLDINGNNRSLFDDSHYVGVDLWPGKNVDVVCLAHDYWPEKAPDVVISTEMLEHDADWELSLEHMVEILRPGGLMLTTCATTGRGEHGVQWAAPADSPGTPRHYRNITEEDFRTVLDLTDFLEFHFSSNNSPADLYFMGIKRNVDVPYLRPA